MNNRQFLPVAIIGSGNKELLQSLMRFSNANEQQLKSYKLLVKSNNYDIVFISLDLPISEMPEKMIIFEHFIFLLDESLAELEDENSTTYKLLKFCSISRSKQIIFAMPTASFPIQKKIESLLKNFEELYSHKIDFKFLQISLFDSQTLFNTKKVTQQPKTSLVETIDKFFVVQKNANAPLRLKVQNVKDNLINISIEQGILRKGDRLLIYPESFILKFNKIYYLKEEVSEAIASQWVTIEVAENLDKIHPGNLGFSTFGTQPELNNLISCKIRLLQKNESLQNYECDIQIKQMYDNNLQQIQEQLNWNDLKDGQFLDSKLQVDKFAQNVGDKFLIYADNNFTGVGEITKAECNVLIEYEKFRRQYVTEESDIRCRICMTENAEIVMKPCGHVRYCLQCLNLFENICGLCEMKIEEKCIVKIVFDDKEALFNKCDICMKKNFKFIEFKEKNERAFLCEDCIPKPKNNKQESQQNLLKLNI